MMTKAAGVPSERVKGPYDLQQWRKKKENENQVKIKMFKKVNCKELNKFLSNCFITHRNCINQTVSVKLLDQLENIAAAEESMLIESLGHYYMKHKWLGMITGYSAPSVVCPDAVELCLFCLASS